VPRRPRLQCDVRLVPACPGSAAAHTGVEELYELMVDAAIGLIPLPEQPSGHWRADLATIAQAACATLSAHPWFAQLGIHPVAGPLTQRLGVVALRSFAGLGLDPATEVNILSTTNNYIFGFVQREAAWQRLPGRGTPLSPEHLSVRTALHGDDSFEYRIDLRQLVVVAEHGYASSVLGASC
jgi:hypothetical protein